MIGRLRQCWVKYIKYEKTRNHISRAVRTGVFNSVGDFNYKNMHIISLNQTGREQTYPMIYNVKINRGGLYVRFVTNESINAETEFEYGDGIFKLDGEVVSRPAKGIFDVVPTHYELTLKKIATFKFIVGPTGRERLVTPI